MENREKILLQLKKIGISQKEGEVYYELVRNPYTNGSKIAKKLGYPRTSIYALLSKLISKNCIVSIPKDGTTTYKAIKPEILIKRIKDEVEKASEVLIEEFRKIETETKESHFYNITTSDGVDEKIMEILKGAKKEVYINTNFAIEQLEKFKDTFRDLKEKKVRVIFFSFENEATEGYEKLIGEHYKRKAIRSIDEKFKRILLVADMEIAFMASNYDGDYYGTFSKNGLLVNIIAEHIHNDIYIMKLEENSEKNIWKNLKLKTMQELENKN